VKTNLSQLWPKSFEAIISVAIFLMTGLAFAPNAAAQAALTMSTVGAASSSATDYWTPERMANAKPLPLPRVAATNVKIESAARASGPAVGANGSPGLLNAVPDNRNVLFVPKAAAASQDDLAAPEAFGTSGAPFTSSRLVPNAATAAGNVYPNRINGKLFFTKPGVGNFVCSATVQRPGIITTAGHCVHKGSGGSSGFFTNFSFVPALRNGVGPFNTWPATFVVVTGTWASGGGTVPNAADYAIIELAPRTCSGATRLIGNCIGFAGFQTGSFFNEHITSIGYPCNIDSCNIVHRVDSEPHQNVSPNNITIGSDMTGGSSGGGWYQNYGEYGSGQPTGSNTGANRLRAVTSWGFVSTAPKVQGASIFDSRFAGPASSILSIACAHRAGNC
jgi:V8-like Glu-specific endopeptidase